MRPFHLNFCVLLLLTVGQAQQPQVPFVGVALDADTNAADTKLMTDLTNKTNIKFTLKAEEGYGSAINRLVDWRETDGSYIARMTPYAYVVAERLGAKMDVLATYRSNATNGSHVYHSYFVVNRSDFVGIKDIKAHHLLDFINNRESPVRFVYHGKFSTSGYFVPAQFFRNQHIFSEAKIIATEVNSDLVRYVAEHPGEIAAVWDKEKRLYEQITGQQSKVYFIQLQTIIPNDLLVCSSWMKKEYKENILKAIDGLMINKGDFIKWDSINSAPTAKLALGELRRLAGEHSAPVTITLAANGDVPQEVMEALRQGIRLSGTEFVLHDELYAGDLAAHNDATWTVTAIHDGAILLKTHIDDVKLDAQEFPISFVDQFDLTKRLIALIHQRMDRIRYVWPYDGDNPTILRDVDFSVDKGSMIRIQKITWLDFSHYQFALGEDFQSEITEADAFKFRLKSVDAGHPFTLDPLSNIAYRAILERPSIEEPLFVKLTIGLVIIFLLAGIAAAADLRRRNQLTPIVRSRSELFQERLQLCIHRYHAQFGQHVLADKDVIWCDRKALEEEISELKVQGEHVRFDTVRSSKRTTFLWLKLSTWKIFGMRDERVLSEELAADPSKVGDVSRLNDLLGFLVSGNRLSQFIGDIPIFTIFESLVAEFLDIKLPEHRNSETHLLTAKNEILASRISDQVLNEIMPDADRQLSLFRHNWTISESGDSYIFSHIVKLPHFLLIDGSNVDDIKIECRVPKAGMMSEAVLEDKLDAWVLGKIKSRNMRVKELATSLVIRFSLLALVTKPQ